MSFRKLSGRPGSTSFRTTSFRSSSNMSNLSSGSVLTDDSPSIMSMRRSISNLSSQRFTEECGLINSHAATLDRLFAWEKKLYKEMKVRITPGSVKQHKFEVHFFGELCINLILLLLLPLIGCGPNYELECFDILLTGRGGS